jgi:hypothetical protein
VVFEKYWMLAGGMYPNGAGASRSLVAVVQPLVATQSAAGVRAFELERWGGPTSVGVRRSRVKELVGEKKVGAPVVAAAAAVDLHELSDIDMPEQPGIAVAAEATSLVLPSQNHSVPPQDPSEQACIPSPFLGAWAYLYLLDAAASSEEGPSPWEEGQ